MGKTTTVRSILGLTRARGGAVSFRGRRIEREAPDRIARMGIALVPEGRQIFPNLSVREHLVAFAENRSGRRDPWTPEKVFQLFPRLEESREPWETSFPAASSRCSPSAARSSPTRIS